MTSLCDPLECLKATEVFAAAPDAALAGLAGLAREEHYTDRSLLTARGATPDRLWHVLEGSVELGLYSEAGRPALLAPIMAGGWATWLGCFHRAPLPHDLWTGPNTRLLAFPAAAVRRLGQDCPAILPAVINRIGERMRDLIGWSLAASLSDPERRLANLLAVSARGVSASGDGSVELALTQDRLAAMGFGTRQRVARLIRALTDRGLVEGRYGRIRICSPEALDAFAAG
ncbi:MAG: helix-turn-helix domain-containing protein [Caulobacter sp.]|nr:helix-turn-helix domain-containing protein [Caulobacter sp.]